MTGRPNRFGRRSPSVGPWIAGGIPPFISHHLNMDSVAAVLPLGLINQDALRYVFSLSSFLVTDIVSGGSAESG